MRLFRRTANIPIDHQYFLSLLGGAEAGIATTTAIVIALLIENLSISIVLTTAIISISVQAFNASASRYASLRRSNEIEDQADNSRFEPLINATIQFGAHFSIGLIPILPIFFVERGLMVVACILTAFILALFVGVIQGKYLKIQANDNLIELLVICTLVILVGVGAGFIIR